MTESVRNRYPKHFLFFSQTSNGHAAANAFLARLNERKEDRDTPVSNETIHAQLSYACREDTACPLDLAG